MADWKTQISYNYHSPYHAYAFGLMYPHGAEQNNGNLPGWGDPGVVDFSNYNGGITQAYYGTANAKTRDESPPESPEQHAVNDHCQYRGSGVVYLGDAQSGRMVLAPPHQVTYDERASDVRRAQSETTSDSEPHASPDSWRSVSSRDGCFPQADPVTWTRKDPEREASSRRSDVCEDVSNSVIVEPRPLAVTGDPNINNPYLHVPLPTPKKPGTKGKVRAAFSESQMNILVQRFSVQRYLTPAEMKNLAEMTGLTYKQVKTWFQNRRMKLRRQQKDTSWVCERYNINKDTAFHGSMYSNIPPHMPPYQGEARPQLKEQYNQYMTEEAFRKTAPQNLAFYFAAMGNAAGSAGYPSWSSTSSQAAVPNRAQVAGWPMPQGVGHYDYNPNSFNPAAANNSVQNTSFESQDGESVNNCGSNTMTHNASQ